MPPCDPYNILLVLGPTASGKTQLATRIAKEINGEIISADSRQVYRRMDIGTGKDLEDFTVEGVSVPYHLIDIAEPGSKYNVFEYQKDFFNAFISVKERGHFPVLCGGTGMYIDAILKGYRLIQVPVNSHLRKELSGKTLTELEEILSRYQKLHNKTDTDTKKRAIRAIEIREYYKKYPQKEEKLPDIRPLTIGIDISREKRRKRITERLQARLNSGMIEEVEKLLEEGLSYENLIYYGLEYKYLALYLKKEMSYNEMFNKLNTAIHQFSKRQMTWFRKMEREGRKIHWIAHDLDTETKIRKIKTLLNRF